MQIWKKFKMRREIKHIAVGINGYISSCLPFKRGRPSPKFDR